MQHWRLWTVSNHILEISHIDWGLWTMRNHILRISHTSLNNSELWAITSSRYHMQHWGLWTVSNPIMWIHMHHQVLWIMKCHMQHCGLCNGTNHILQISHADLGSVNRKCDQHLRISHAALRTWKWLTNNIFWISHATMWNVNCDQSYIMDITWSIDECEL